MSSVLIALLIVQWVITICLVLYLIHLGEWIDTVDEELECISFNIQNTDKRLNSLERITIDIEQDIRKEVYSQLNTRIIEGLCK